MVMPQLAPEWTRDRLRELPEDGRRYELVAGVLLVTPSPRPRHQDAVQALYDLIGPYVKRHRAGHVYWPPADLELRTGEWYQPDLFVMPWTEGPRPTEWSQFGAPVLVIEVSSPSTARYDRAVKRVAFQEVGIPEYWVVDLDARLVERWRPDDHRPEVLIDQLVWMPADAPEPLQIDLTRLFAEVWA